MRVSTFAPGERLAPYVRRFTIVESEATVTRTLLPETGLTAGFRYAGAARDGDRALPDHTLAGLRDTARRMLTVAGSGIVLAMFRPGAAAAFFAAPLHELFGATAPLDAVVAPRELAPVAERIAAARDPAARVAALEAFLVARLDPARRDPLVGAALAAIRDARGQIRAGELARAVGLSRDRLEKRFRRVVGTTPKQLARLVRVRRALALVGTGAELGRAAVDAGFYDQAHFTREWKRVTGAAPGRFFAAGEHC